MRIRLTKAAAVILSILNLILIYNIYKMVSPLNNSAAAKERRPPQEHTRSVQLSLTVVFRHFEHFDNDLVSSISSFSNVHPNLDIVVISDSPIYPPLQFQVNASLQHLHVVSLNVNLNSSVEERNPLSFIKTNLVLFVPDSVRLPSPKFLQQLLAAVDEIDPRALVIPTEGSADSITCLRQDFNVKEWTVHLTKEPGGALCDAVQGKHALLLRATALRNFPEPFMRPFPEALFLQASARGIKFKLIRDVQLKDGKTLTPNGHLLWKAENAELKRRLKAYKELGVKKVVRETGKTEWYGCSKKSQRCFGSVAQDTPEYLLSGRWTPPCCLEALRKTARHVFSVLDESGVRYWLEGGSLLGAMRHSDIIPWDYDVDIGIYEDDIARSKWLMRASTKSVLDDKGFVWEKAQPSEGAFFRVHYSQTNRLHVDIFPFRATADGKMTKDYWFQSHPQDREFPEHFLHPISSINFAGRKVSAPNNVRDFLELKFGKGAIENPEYPNPHVIKLKP